MASVMVLGTPGPVSPESTRLVADLLGRPLGEPDDIRSLPGFAAGMADFFGASSMERLPTEVAITESMRRFTRVADAAKAS
jgi:predicted TIM-barrel enzyme